MQLCVFWGKKIYLGGSGVICLCRHKQIMFLLPLMSSDQIRIRDLMSEQKDGHLITSSMTEDLVEALFAHTLFARTFNVHTSPFNVQLILETSMLSWLANEDRIERETPSTGNSHEVRGG